MSNEISHEKSIEMELSPDHVVLPRQDYLDLQEAAMLSTPMSGSERLGAVVQTTAVFAGLSLAFTGAAWGWVKAKNWLDERNFQRRVRAGEFSERHKS
jgi:hypothetical protein